MKRNRTAILVLLCLAGTTGLIWAQKAKTETGDNYFKQWVDRDVSYIITDEERAVFLKLSTPEEKENFIEQFWKRRDPNPETPENEYRVEHYRRIAYVNAKFGFGRPGWVSDRGRAYITLGPPDEIEQHPSGGSYDRRMSEGGGYTATFPFERWWYRNIPGVGDDIELEFVDPSWSGEYRLAMSPEEKDAHLHVAGAGPTLYEMMGLTARQERPYFKPGVLGTQAHQFGFKTTSKDNPFTRMQELNAINRPPEIKFKDLQQVISTKVSYNLLPFTYTVSHILAAGDRFLTPVTVLVQNKDLTFKRDAGSQSAVVQIYGQVIDLTGRTAAVFEDAMAAQFEDGEFERGLTLKSIYQRPLLLPSGRYKLNLVLKDANSGRMGTADVPLLVQKIEDDRLAMCPVVMSEKLEPASDNEPVGSPFVLGRLKIIPKLENVFTRGNPAGLYFELYNASLDTMSGKPDVSVEIRVSRDGKDVSTNNLFVWQYFDRDRVLFAQGLATDKLDAGLYNVDIAVTDRLGNRSIRSTASFTIQ